MFPTHYRTELAFKTTFGALGDCLADSPAITPKISRFWGSALFEAQVLGLQNTAAVNFAGNPALAIPVPILDKSASITSLQLVGAPH
jgi:amidase